MLILKVLVGSRAYGLADVNSDYDYRGVFVHPTSMLLSVGVPKPNDTTWVHGPPGRDDKDDTAWELGHFLHLALQCNPAILECFAAPFVDDLSGIEGLTTKEGFRLQELFPYVWTPSRVRDAFIGYGLNQRKKMLEDRDTRWRKYAAAYLRVLYQGFVLLSTGSLFVDMRGSDVFNDLKRYKAGEVTMGEVVNTCKIWQARLEDAVADCPHKPDVKKVNEFLLDVRRNHW